MSESDRMPDTDTVRTGDLHPDLRALQRDIAHAVDLFLKAQGYADANAIDAYNEAGSILFNNAACLLKRTLREDEFLAYARTIWITQVADG